MTEAIQLYPYVPFEHLLDHHRLSMLLLVVFWSTGTLTLCHLAVTPFVCDAYPTHKVPHSSHSTLY